MLAAKKLVVGVGVASIVTTFAIANGSAIADQFRQDAYAARIRAAGRAAENQLSAIIEDQQRRNQMSDEIYIWR